MEGLDNIRKRHLEGIKMEQDLEAEYRIKKAAVAKERKDIDEEYFEALYKAHKYLYTVAERWDGFDSAHGCFTTCEKAREAADCKFPNEGASVIQRESAYYSRSQLMMLDEPLL